MQVIRLDVIVSGGINRDSGLYPDSQELQRLSPGALSFQGNKYTITGLAEYLG